MASSLTNKVPESHTYESIALGSVYSFDRVITKDDVLAFARLTGDQNKLHVDEEFGKKTRFGKNVVHGMLLGSLFSTIIGMYCPGENSLYLSQSLSFKRPVFYEDKVTVKATVTNKIDALKVIVLKMELIKEGLVAIEGEAKAKVL
jgi:3-hydroxybutyryl-CoA dehydratase